MHRSTLQGRIAVVTGASKGLGRAMALALADQGARVALVARGSDALEALTGQIQASGGEAEAFVADAGNEYDVLRLESEVQARMGRAQIVINNAGVALRKNVTDITLAEWNVVQTANLTSAFLMSKAFIPHMRGTGYGRILNIASVMAHVAIPQRAAYASSKAGMLGLTRTMALELARDAITVNAICPGWFETEMTAGLQQNPEVNDQIMAKVPMGRWGRPEEIGGLAVYLCGENAGFITGTDIVIDGGWCTT
jgi:NAD(P)-dependent dehydrogenase (short-subunit alcohol dehydrogenase family)